MKEMDTSLRAQFEARLQELKVEHRDLDLAIRNGVLDDGRCRSSAFRR